METMRSNSSNKSSANKDPGIYTCPTCNALFTCLKFYQQHVSQHAEANGTKLFCCNRCRYSTDSSFQYNWHQMSHKNTPAHSCSVCQDKPNDNYNSNNHLNGRDDSVATGKSSRKAQQNGNSNKRVKYSNSKVKQEPFVKQEESEEDDDDDDESDEGESDTEENEDEENENEEDDEEASDSDEEESEEDEEEIDEEVDQTQLQNVTTYALTGINNQAEEDEDEMSDEDDDEESEIESEEDNGENNDVPDEYIVSQRLNRQEGDSTDYHYDMQNANAHGSNNNNSSTNNSSDPYGKASSVVSDLPELAVNDGIIINNKGKGKGNRKSRTINQMGGQVDDEMSQLRRKFHCSHCGKSFKTKSHLQRHILTHTGEKPYHCNRCGAKFNQSSSLRNHIIALHTKEYPHFCNHCNKGFLMPALLQKHLQTSHRDQDG